MRADIENTLVHAVARDQYCSYLLRDLHAKWDDRTFNAVTEEVLQEFGLNLWESDVTHRGLILTVRGSELKRPAFIHCHSMPESLYDYSVCRRFGLCSIEVVEAGKYVVAGDCKEPYFGAEAEG